MKQLLTIASHVFSKIENNYPSQLLTLALGEYSVALPPNFFNLGLQHSLKKYKSKLYFQNTKVIHLT